MTETSASDPGNTGAERTEIQELRQAERQKTPVEGKVIGWNNGGLHVVIGGVTAFCPRSEMEMGQPKGPEAYLDNSYSFQVLKIQKNGRRVVLSRVAALRSERAKTRSEIRKKLQVGAVLEGRVVSLTDFGAFVELGGGLEGLVHVSKISHQRIESPSEVLTVGDKVNVKVLKVEKGGKRISLSMREFEPNPWKEDYKRFPAGSVVEGKVQKAASFGAFIELEPGLTGLLPTSAMSLPRDSSPARAYPPGRSVKVQIVSVDPRRQRMALALEGSSVEGSQRDYQEYARSQKKEADQGFNALASAFRKMEEL